MISRKQAGTALGLLFLLFKPPLAAAASAVKQELAHEASFFTTLAEFLVHPAVIPVLLSLGCLGFVMELFTRRFGLPGLIGIISFSLFFYGHLMTGAAGIWSLVFFAAGIILILLEMVIPGGVIGIIGFGAFLASFFLATNHYLHMAFSLFIAFTIATLACIVMIKVFDKKMKFFKKLILTEATTTESGYVSNQNRTELLGLTGTTLTDLRPSGTVLIGDERIDVVSNGSFIPKGTVVKFIKVEGSRIVVRELMESEKK